MCPEKTYLSQVFLAGNMRSTPATKNFLFFELQANTTKSVDLNKTKNHPN